MADHYAGQTVHCSHCGKVIAVPLSDGDSVPDDGDVRPRRGPRRWSTCLMVLLGCLFVMMVIALMLPPVGAPREAGRRVQCKNNLQRIGLAMRNYEQAHGCFPPYFIPDENGKPTHSWRVLILPFLGEDRLYKQYRFDEPWNGPHNKELASRMPAVYRCPTYAAMSLSDEATNSLTSYAMIVGPHAISGGPTPHKMSDVTDGLSNTIMVVECAGAGINWLEPRDLNAEEITNVRIGSGEYKNPPGGINSYHPGVANTLFCDGTVRAVDQSVGEKVLKGMLTIDGGESVSMDELR
ncbi:MAG: DUF1559 domain-containing protein [Planctomycetia bacterium]|nr:DUF1559 domain-containing protein [Planctomycetia bacterium]